MAGASFDTVARAYRWLEYLSFGPWLSRCRCAHVTQLTEARHALVLGDGDGRFLARLLAANPMLTADVVDSSETMLRLLDRRVCKIGAGARRRIGLQHANALQWSPGDDYDLIVSHFFLDCLFAEELEGLLDRILPKTVPGVRWVISEFAIPSGSLAGPVGRGIVFVLYRAFGWLTGLRVRALPDYAGALRRRGFMLMHERKFLWGLLCCQVWGSPG